MYDPWLGYDPDDPNSYPTGGGVPPYEPGPLDTPQEGFPIPGGIFDGDNGPTPPPNEGQGTGNPNGTGTGTGGGGGVDWKHDQNNYPYAHDPHPPNDPGGSWEWYWNGTEWMTRPGPPGSVSTGGGGGNRGGWQLAPFTGGSYAFPMLTLPDLGALPEPEPYPDWVPEAWKAPDPSEIQNDPSYSWRFEEGLRPIRADRAARGLTRTGATLKELSRYGQGFASNEYDRIYNRAADSYDRRNAASYQAWSGNRQNRLDTYDRRRANVLDSYDRAVTKARAEYEPKAHWADLQFARDWDLYKYQQDDAFRRWAKEGDWASGIATSYPRE